MKVYPRATKQQVTRETKIPAKKHLGWWISNQSRERRCGTLAEREELSGPSLALVLGDHRSSQTPFNTAETKFFPDRNEVEEVYISISSAALQPPATVRAS
ncbi:hypothetical protein TNCV_3464001 [Trichonephila clavipes]|nr:hypothetical protein TNCV_3464001 [Trichonephila clavipes]